MTERYRSFDLGGWHVVVLDSTFPKGDGYTARLDDTQREWPAGDLKATPRARPVLVLSHIPILCGCAFLDGHNEECGDWVVPGAWMHTDARAIKDLFHQHPNIRVCLSGHIHLRDRLKYNGVTYLCNGAVSGGWWKLVERRLSGDEARFRARGPVRRRLLRVRLRPHRLASDDGVAAASRFGEGHEGAEEHEGVG